MNLRKILDMRVKKNTTLVNIYTPSCKWVPWLYFELVVDDQGFYFAFTDLIHFGLCGGNWWMWSILRKSK